MDLKIEREELVLKVQFQCQILEIELQGERIGEKKGVGHCFLDQTHIRKEKVCLLMEVVDYLKFRR